MRYPSLLSWLCLLAMWGFSYFRCYELLIRPTPAEQLMVSFETASLVLLAAALCTAAGVLPLDTALAPAAGTLLALAALAGQRASNSRPGGQAARLPPGRLLLLLLLAALAGAQPCACCCSPAPPPRPSPPSPAGCVSWPLGRWPFWTGSSAGSSPSSLPRRPAP